jgi:hypothetical protein
MDWLALNSKAHPSHQPDGESHDGVFNEAERFPDAGLTPDG